VVLPKRAIEITSHAQQRAFHRLRLEKGKRTHEIREALRQGNWYENPDQPHEFLVVHRVENKPVCLTVAAEDRQLTVTTVYPMKNTGKIRAYRQHGPELDAQDIAQRYRIRR
jgi:hypothetical protein